MATQQDWGEYNKSLKNEIKLKDTALKHQSEFPLLGSSVQDQRPGLRVDREIHGEQSRDGQVTSHQPKQQAKFKNRKSIKALESKANFNRCKNTYICTYSFKKNKNHYEMYTKKQNLFT